jgi:hypothetical protein
LTNQLRLNSKALFDPSLKEKKPIVIEDQDTDEDPSGFTNMEEMAIHTLKEMPVGKTKRSATRDRPQVLNLLIWKQSTPLVQTQRKIWWTLVQTLSRILKKLVQKQSMSQSRF